jgi:type I restriction enzyme S subunit
MELKPGYKQTEIGVIPEDWDSLFISSLATVETGAKNTQDRVMEGAYPFFVRSQEVERINSYSFDGEAVLTAGDGVGTGKVFHYIKGKFDTHQRVYRMSNFDSRIDGYFFFLMFSSRFYDRIMSMTAKSSVDSVRRDMIVGMQIPVPTSVKEQKAIAEALSDVDALIDSLEALLIKKRNIKTGVMQELLTGRTRLPGFTGDWHEVCLEDFADCFDHLRIPLNESERLTRVGDYPYCGANGVLGFIDEYLIDDEMVLIAEDGGYFDEFATRPIAYKMSGKYWVNNHAHVLKAKPSQDNNYLYYSLVHKDVTPYLASGTRAKLNKSEMWKIGIRAPKSKTEQEAIVNVLSDIDDEIEALDKRLAKTRDLKQGMAQELLTGRTRLI